MDITGIIIMACINVIAIFFTSYFTRKGNNKADKEDIHDISLESELGKNLATKQDIEEITHKIESVRNEVSFENQRKHNFVEERKEMFLSVLSLVEGVLNNANNLLYFLYDETTIDEMKLIIQDTNDKILKLNHNSRIILVTFNNDATCEQVIKLTVEATKFSSLVCTTAINARNSMISIKNFLLLINSGKTGLVDSLTKYREKLNDFRQEYKEEKLKQWKLVDTELDEYLTLLYSLYKVQFHIKADLKFENN